MKTAVLRILVLFALISAGCGGGGKSGELIVYTGTNLADVMEEIGREFHNETGIAVRFNFQPTGISQRQVERGAPADLFIAPHPSFMDALQEKGLIDRRSRIALLRNEVVIIVPANSTLQIETIDDIASEGVRAIAMPDPEIAAAGMYAKEYLERLNLWGRITDRIRPMLGVRAALKTVEGKNADIGFVFYTDTLISTGVKIAYRFPREFHSGSNFQAAIVSSSGNKALAERLLRFLRSEKAAAILKKHGYNPI